MRQKRDRFDLKRGLRRRRLAQIRRWIVIPLSALLGVAMVREVRIAWNVSEYYSESELICSWSCSRRCGTLTNDDAIRRMVTIRKYGDRVETTLLPHGKIDWACTDCTIEVAGVPMTPAEGAGINLRIEHGALQPLQH